MDERCGGGYPYGHLAQAHIATDTRPDLIDTNITGALNLTEEAALVGVAAFIFKSTTSA
jgi:nucleoside-diphosphate-sugar epimerase